MISNMKRFIYVLAAFALTLNLSGCKDFFDPETNDRTNEEDYLNSTSDLYSGFLGVSKTVQDVAEKAMFLEGLRNDFLEPTYQSPQDYWDVYGYADHLGSGLKGNDLASPEGYYRVIMNANDYISHVIEFNEKTPTALAEEEFNALVGSTIRYKVWAYMMLAKIYGEAIYFDDPLTQYHDLVAAGHNFWKFDQIIDKCIDLIENGVDINGKMVNGRGNMVWSTYLDPVSESPDIIWDRLCPLPEVLLAELYLWKGNFQAALNNAVATINLGPNPEYAHWMYSSFEREGNWVGMFRGFRDTAAIAGASYNYEYQQVNNLINYFSNSGSNVYYMRPSQAAIDRFTAVGEDGRILAGTYRSEGYTFGTQSGERVVSKFIPAGAAGTGADKTVNYINLYRSHDMYIIMVEALNNLERFQAALKVLNGDGVQSTNQGSDFKGHLVDGAYPESSYLYGLPARMGNGYTYAYLGIRMGVSASRVGTRVLEAPNLDTSIDRKFIDSLIVEEYGYEFAGEGKPLHAMIRNIRRYPENITVWAKKVAAKYDLAENSPVTSAQVEELLSADINNWFIKYDLEAGN